MGAWVRSRFECRPRGFFLLVFLLSVADDPAQLAQGRLVRLLQ